MKVSAQEKQKIILENLSLVKKVASKIYFKLPKDANIDFDELVNTGTIGLIKAIDKYNQDKAQFSTYAYIKIRGEILDYLRSLHIVPRTMRDKIKKEKEENRDIPLSNLAIMLSMDKALSGDENGPKLVDILVSQEKSPEEFAISSEISDKIVEAMNSLSITERKTLQMLFFEEKTPKEVAMSLNISQSRVSQIKSQALKKLQKSLGEMEL